MDISKIQLETGTYDIKDVTARQQISNLENKTIITFENITALQNVENINNGNFVKTFDNKGSFYKIREKLENEIIDNINIIELTNFDTLVAEKIQNKIDTFELKLQPNIIYDLEDTSYSQGSCLIDNILYVYVENNFPYGDVLKFNVTDGLYVGKIENVKLYHGNDMCSVGDYIFVTSTKDNSGNLNNKTIICLDVENETVTEILPEIFTSIAQTHLFGIATYDSDNLLLAFTTISNISSMALYLYNITEQTIKQITITNIDNIPTNIFYAFQSIEFLEDKIYIMTSLNDLLLEFDYFNYTANFNKVYNLPLIDCQNQIIGEYEGISKCEIFGKNALMITTIITDNTYNNYKTIKAYVVNPVNDLSISNLIYPNIIYTTSNEQRAFQYLKKSSTSLFENGTTSYPYKSLSRALRSVDKISSINSKNIIITDSQNYYIDQIAFKNVAIISTQNPHLYVKRILDSNIAFSGESGRKYKNN